MSMRPQNSKMFAIAKTVLSVESPSAIVGASVRPRSSLVRARPRHNVIIMLCVNSANGQYSFDIYKRFHIKTEICIILIKIGMKPPRLTEMASEVRPVNFSTILS